MLTLCGLAAPVTIRPPQAPQLKPFKFFVGRSRQSDGREQFFLHMGYFATRAEAEKWALVLRRNYPNAAPSLVPRALLQHSDSGVPTLSPVQGQTLTDTQVLSVLEGRVSAHQPAGTSEAAAQISLLRPEDSGTRQIIKEAVVQGAPVSFAVQLLWSVQPIDVASVPSVSIFKLYTLYVTQGRREGRTWYCLRLGFFQDAIAAKQVAHFVRPSFAAVAVVPITEEERTDAAQTRVDLNTLAAALSVDSSTATKQPTGGTPAKPAKQRPASAQKGRSSETLEQTLEMLAASEVWNSEDSFSETGVRHLTVQVQKKPASRRS